LYLRTKQVPYLLSTCARNDVMLYWLLGLQTRKTVLMTSSPSFSYLLPVIVFFNLCVTSTATNWRDFSKLESCTKYQC